MNSKLKEVLCLRMNLHLKRHGIVTVPMVSQVFHLSVIYIYKFTFLLYILTAAMCALVMDIHTSMTERKEECTYRVIHRFNQICLLINFTN